MDNKATRNAIIRGIVTMILFINMVLTAMGKNPIPFDETAVTEWLSIGLSGLSILWSWYKDAPVTKKGKKVQEYKESIAIDGVE